MYAIYAGRCRGCVETKPYICAINCIVPLELKTLKSPPFASPDQQRVNSLCPVHTWAWAKPRLGKPITKQQLSHWIVLAISLAYSSKGLTALPGLHAHPTRGMSS